MQPVQLDYRIHRLSTPPEKTGAQEKNRIEAHASMESDRLLMPSICTGLRKEIESPSRMPHEKGAEGSGHEGENAAKHEG
jgi:hypothetical protein